MEKLDTLVIGAGVVGLAVARALAQAGREVLLVEKNERFGEETSARNSEVIHAGLYYPAGSLKATSCIRGNRLLYDFCQSHDVAHRACGKLLVATHPDQLPALHALQAKAAANQCVPLQWLDKVAVQQLEPALTAEAALFSPSTGIIDSHGLMLALLADLEAAGGQLLVANQVTGGQIQPGNNLVQLDDFSLEAELVVNAAGLHAPDLARQLHGPQDWIPQAHYAKGHYFSLIGKSPFSHLIYPLPEAGGLGVHLTLDLQGRARFGPDVQWLTADSPAALDYTVDLQRRSVFAEAIRRYWPEIRPQQLQPDYAGIRPKITPAGTEDADFYLADAAVHGCPGVVHLLGIESPGLTACLALAEEVTRRLLNRS